MTGSPNGKSGYSDYDGFSGIYRYSIPRGYRVICVYKNIEPKYREWKMEVC